MIDRIPLAKNDGNLYDVVEVDLYTLKVEVMGAELTAQGADAVTRMAIMRRSCARG